MQACPIMGIMVTLGTLARASLLEPELALEQPLLLTTTTTSNSMLLYYTILPSSAILTASCL